MRNSGEWDLPICILTHPSSNFQPRLSLRGFPGGSDGKESACNVGDPGLIPGLGRSPGEGNDYNQRKPAQGSEDPAQPNIKEMINLKILNIFIYKKRYRNWPTSSVSLESAD